MFLREEKNSECRFSISSYRVLEENAATQGVTKRNLEAMNNSIAETRDLRAILRSGNKSQRVFMTNLLPCGRGEAKQAQALYLYSLVDSVVFLWVGVSFEK